MSNVLVTGGLGFVGSHTVVELGRAGYTPVIIDDLSNSSADARVNIEKLIGRPLDVRISDFADVSVLRALMSEYEFSSVIHFAGLKSVPESHADPLRYFDVNVARTVQLLDSMDEAGISDFVFSSSATVYGDSAEVPFAETSTLPKASSPYGLTKRVVEQLCEVWVAEAASEKSAIMLRYFNPVGADPSGELGEAPQGVPSNLLPFVADVAAGARSFVSVYGTDYPTRDGSGIRDYIHVCDLARGHVSAVLFARENRGYEVINLGSGVGSSVLEIIDLYEVVSGRKIKRVKAGRREGDVAISLANIEKAKKLLGWSPHFDLKEICEHSWRWRNTGFGRGK